jgi:hypothetical protein
MSENFTKISPQPNEAQNEPPGDGAGRLRCWSVCYFQGYASAGAAVTTNTATMLRETIRLLIRVTCVHLPSLIPSRRNLTKYVPHGEIHGYINAPRGEGPGQGGRNACTPR